MAFWLILNGKCGTINLNNIPKHVQNMLHWNSEQNKRPSRSCIRFIFSEVKRAVQGLGPNRSRQKSLFGGSRGWGEKRTTSHFGSYVDPWAGGRLVYISCTLAMLQATPPPWDLVLSLKMKSKRVSRPFKKARRANESSQCTAPISVENQIYYTWCERKKTSSLSDSDAQINSRKLNKEKSARWRRKWK